MTAPDTSLARAAAAAIASRLASPSQTRDVDVARGWWPQSLAHGAAGAALLHIERAHAGLGRWQVAHDWLSCASSGEISAGPNSGLFYGAPAVAFALHAAVDRPGKYARALSVLDHHIAAMTRRRVDQAHTRIDHAGRPTLAEFDLIRGLTGLGAYLLQRDPHGDPVREVLSYLVRLTEPLYADGILVPGWWTDLDPAGQLSKDFPGGHGNFGMAHGISGPLALLSLALKRGVVVNGHAEAIGRICAWLDDWRQDHDAGPWWPYWVTRDELGHHRSTQSGPSRPSWCYGTPGLARAQQLAGQAAGDVARQRMAEQALIGCLSDRNQLAAITDTTLCHGWAGLFHIVWRVAADAHTPDFAAHLPRLVGRIVEHGTFGIGADQIAESILSPPAGGLGLLEGAAGVALALHTAAAGPPNSNWDTCLLIG